MAGANLKALDHLRAIEILANKALEGNDPTEAAALFRRAIVIVEGEAAHHGELHPSHAFATMYHQKCWEAQVCQKRPALTVPLQHNPVLTNVTERTEYTEIADLVRAASSRSGGGTALDRLVVNVSRTPTQSKKIMDKTIVEKVPPPEKEFEYSLAPTLDIQRSEETSISNIDRIDALEQDMGKWNRGKQDISFISGREKMRMDEAKKKRQRGGTRRSPVARSPPPVQEPRAKQLGGRRKFVSPLVRQPRGGSKKRKTETTKTTEQQEDDGPTGVLLKALQSIMKHKHNDGTAPDGMAAKWAETRRQVISTLEEGEMPERLKAVDHKMVEQVCKEIVDTHSVRWGDIAGLAFAKQCVREIVVWPLQRPDLFHGLRGPPKGLLLFGPPGTGKTMIGRMLACESSATFFSISASSLMSKWVGEGERMVRALFAVAGLFQPAIVFIDEIDSLLCSRSESEMEGSRRLKTEFLVQWDGLGTSADDRVLVIGATNRPQELDDAARRRLIKRLYIPLPDNEAREHLMTRLMSEQHCELGEKEMKVLVERTKGYSGADLHALCAEAALGPIRGVHDIANVHVDSVRPIQMIDFESALRQVRASVGPSELLAYVDWNKKYGSFSEEEEAH